MVARASRSASPRVSPSNGAGPAASTGDPVTSTKTNSRRLSTHARAESDQQILRLRRVERRLDEWSPLVAVIENDEPHDVALARDAEGADIPAAE